MYFLHKYTGIKPDVNGAFVKPLAASLVMGLACYVVYYISLDLFNRNSVSVLAAIVVGMGMYGAFMVLIRGFKREDLERLPLGRMRKWVR
jgi:stage V sporulation protein B